MDSRWEEAGSSAESGDDQKFLELFGHQFIARHEETARSCGWLIFSALEGHELSEMFSDRWRT